VQQVWGLGVPCWRLLFEAPARVLGQPAFPDRIALVFAMFLLTYAILRTFLFTDGRWADWRKEPDHFFAVCVATIKILQRRQL